MDLTGYNADNHEPLGDFDPIPPGDYLVMLTDSEQKETSKGDGWYLALTFEVCDGPHKGRKLWTNLNLENPNPKAVEIAQRELGDICRAVDVTAPKDSTELHNKPMIAKVGTEKRKDTGELKNKIKGYKKDGFKATDADKKGTPKQTTTPWNK